MDEENYKVLDEMGFSRSDVKMAIDATKQTALQPVTDWLLEHVDSKESKSSDTPTARSIKCQECNKLFKNNDLAQFHAYKSGHQNFEESGEEIKPLTDAEKKQKIENLRVLIAEKKRRDEEERRLEELRLERERREQAKQGHRAKEEYEAQQAKIIAEKIRKEKEDDRIYREKLRIQIEADKKERLARMQTKQPELKTPQEPVTEARSPVVQYNESKLQIRLPDGTSISHSFRAEDKLDQVYSFLRQKALSGTLMTAFPKRALTDLSKSLKELDLVPSAALILNK